MIQDQYFGALHKDAVAEVSSGQWLWPLQGVANRDLKLENLLLDRDGSDGTRPLLKICDFGYSKVCVPPRFACVPDCFACLYCWLREESTCRCPKSLLETKAHAL